MLAAGILALTLVGCRIEERALGEHESYQRWPSPHELATAVDGSYRGKVTWFDTDIPRPPRRMEVRVAIDAKNVRLRYVVEPPFPGERIICSSSLMVPFTVTMTLGDASFTIATTQVLLEPHLGASIELPPAFARAFDRARGEGHRTVLSIPFHGACLGGRIEDRGGVRFRQSGVFLARATDVAKRKADPCGRRVRRPRSA